MVKNIKEVAYPNVRLIVKRFSRILLIERRRVRDKKKKEFKHENTNNKIPRNFIGMDLQDNFEDTKKRRRKIFKIQDNCFGGERPRLFK